ncbi:MAG: phage late control D family protein [Kofleriaceae bacterium]
MTQAQRSEFLDGLALSRRYAPECRIEIEGKELDPAVIADVLQVTVTLELDAPASFQINVNNWDTERFAFKYTEGNIFDLGHRANIELGYADARSSLVRGVITSMSPRFPEAGSPTVSITGLDSMVLLRDRKPTGSEQKQWLKKRDSEIARDIAKRNNLQCIFDESPLEHEVVVQKNQDDAQFLLERAKKIDFDCFIGVDSARRDTLFFVRPRDGRTNDVTRVYQFEWGRNLVSFMPTLTVSRQVSKVTVRGWDSRNMEPIVATATVADLPKPKKRGKRTRSAPDLVENALGRKQDVVVDANPQSKDEAKQMAIAMLRQRAYTFITATMSVMGNAELRAGDNVHVTGLGDRFAGEYHITKADHTFGAAGYMTQLTVRRLYDAEGSS